MGKVKLIYGTIPYVYTTEPKLVYGSVPFVTSPLKVLSSPPTPPPPPPSGGPNKINGIPKADIKKFAGINVNNITSISGVSFN